jgi:rhodanese-related sulfurtransferase
MLFSDCTTTRQELAAIIKGDKVADKDYLVVDVRDDDYVGGNIKSSYNLPSRVFTKNVDELVRKTKDVPVVIFHCALSQERYVVIPVIRPSFGV